MKGRSSFNQQFYYRIFDRVHYDLILLGGIIPEDVPADFIEETLRYLRSPKNILINCQQIRKIPLSWQSYLSSFTQLLDHHRKKISLYQYTSSDQQLDFYNEVAPLQNYDNFLTYLLDCLLPRELKPFNFFKAFVHSVTSLFLTKIKDPVVRKKTFFLNCQEDRLLMGEFNGLLFIRGEDYFFSLSLSISENLLQDFLKVMVPAEILEEGDLQDAMKSGMAEILDRLIGQTELLVKTGSSLAVSEPKVIAGKELPHVEVSFQGKDWLLLKEGLSMIIPFYSSKGPFFVEVWFPREFAQKVMESQSQTHQEHQAHIEKKSHEKI